MALKNGAPLLARARRRRAEEAFRFVARRYGPHIELGRESKEEAITEIEQAMDDMADYVVVSAMT